MRLFLHATLLVVVYVHLTVLATGARTNFRSASPEEKVPAVLRSAERSVGQPSHFIQGIEYTQTGGSWAKNLADLRSQEENPGQAAEQHDSPLAFEDDPTQATRVDSLRPENYEPSTIFQSLRGTEIEGARTQDSVPGFTPGATLQAAQTVYSNLVFPMPISARKFKQLMLLFMLGSHRFSGSAAGYDQKSIADIIRDYGPEDLEKMELLLWEAYQQVDPPEEGASFIRR